MTDLIGDIHGHADELRQLLAKLGYSEKGGVYSHPDRKVLFVGDYIDRGPKIRETLHIVRNMVESGNAIALMGNHEYNALCFHLKDANGAYLRQHTDKNIKQHQETLHQFHANKKEYDDFLDWFMGLPLFYESETFRAVHACWDAMNIEYLQQELKDARLTHDLIHQSAQEGNRLHEPIEDTLKGKELRLPKGYHFEDKDKTIRKAIRIKWWEDPGGRTYRDLSVLPGDHLPEQLIDDEKFSLADFYGPDEKAVFFGHYWLTGHPAPFRENICCLDYSVAKGGRLVAYRYSGERGLEGGNMEFV